MLDRVQLKYEAKAITKNAKASAYVFTLIYLAIGLVHTEEWTYGNYRTA